MADSSIQIWTIGHSTRSFEEFLSLLKGQQIELLADVRRFPGSRRYPQFGQQTLAAALAKKSIEYVHLPELGGRRATRPDSPNTAWRNAAFRGYADYMMTEEFAAGVRRLTALATKKRTTVMCAEALWWQCHRGLIADYLKTAGHTVLHILAHNKIEEHPFTSAAEVVDGKLSYGRANPESDLPLIPRP